jgi:hypothetical protein
MKLIRLTSTEETASFDALFNEDVFIEPNSKVALAQLCLDSEANTVVIDASNDEITFNMFANRIGSVDRSITLAHTDGTAGNPSDYNKNNFQQLINDMIFKINQQLQIDYSTSTTVVQTAELGTQFTMGIGSEKLQSGKMVLSFLMSALDSRFTDLVQNIKQVGGVASLVNNNAGDDSIWNRTEGAVATITNENMTYGTYPITRGAGVWRTRINTWIDDPAETDLNATGMIWALTNVSPSTYGTTTMTNAQITYGIHCDKVAGTYKYIIDGVTTDTGINVVYGTSAATRPHIELAVSGGRVIGNIYQSDGAGGLTVSRSVIDAPYVLLAGETQPPPLYPVAIVRGGFNTGTSGIRFTSIKQTTDPFLDTKNLYQGGVENEITLPAPQQPGTFRTGGSTYFFNFGSVSLASYFGFVDARIPVNNTLRGIQKVIIPTNKFVYTDLSEAILVLLDSIKLKSYDSFDSLELGEGGRRNLLSVIPVPNSKDIIYEPSSLLFLDIDNANEQYIRNIKARILKTDYAPVKTNGLTTMVLLFKGPNE